MFSLIDLSLREYQENIVSTCKSKNTLVVLPTGVGKTAISVALSIDRLNKFPDSKIIVCSPTRPLCQQHLETYKKHTDIPKAKIILYTGVMNPKERRKFWDLGKVFVATPQTIQSDIENKRIDLDEVSLIVIDEAHRSRMNYANTIIARAYMESTCPNKHILALTASPGHTKDKVKEVCDNLFIEDVEIRTDQDDDVKHYVQKKESEVIDVEFPQELKSVHGVLRSLFREKVSMLSKVGFNKPPSVVSKSDLLMLQPRLQGDIKRKNVGAFFGISIVAQALKLDYASEMLETQGVSQCLEYLNRLSSETSKASKNIVSNKRINEIKNSLTNYVNNDLLHPKMVKFRELLSEQLSINPNARVIVFANYRSTVEELTKIASNIKNAKPVALMGQKDGVTQKQQLGTLSDFESGKFNILLATSIGEEGLSIGGLDLAIFYDHVASAIRRIQRSGRVARIKPGRVIYIITKNTRDAAFFWKSRRDEKTMGNIMTNIKKDLQNSSLRDY